jgi:hypothetical protein
MRIAMIGAGYVGLSPAPVLRISGIMLPALTRIQKNFDPCGVARFPFTNLASRNFYARMRRRNGSSFQTK